MTSNRDLVRVGRVVKPHGIRGELVVEVEGDTLLSLEEGTSLRLGGEEHTFAGSRPHQGRLLVRLEGCTDRNGAEALRGSAVLVPRDMLAAPGEDEWYVDDLVGWDVHDAGKSVGRVTRVIEGAAHDYLQLDDAAASLIPMVRSWLRRVDADSRRIELELPAGLLGGADPGPEEDAP